MNDVDFNVQASYMEVYNEQVFDLMSDSKLPLSDNTTRATSAACVFISLPGRFARGPEWCACTGLVHLSCNFIRGPSRVSSASLAK